MVHWGKDLKREGKIIIYADSWGVVDKEPKENESSSAGGGYVLKKQC